MSGLTLENIPKAVPMTNTGSVGDHILLIEARHLTALPDPTGSTLEAMGSIPAASITRAAGQAWRRIDCTLDKGGVKSEPLGGRDQTTFRNTATIHLAHNNELKIGFSNFVSNKDFIALVPERASRKYRVLGRLIDPAHIKAASDTGDAPDGDNENRFVIESIGPMAPMVTGPITVGP